MITPPRFNPGGSSPPAQSGSAPLQRRPKCSSSPLRHEALLWTAGEASAGADSPSEVEGTIPALYYREPPFERISLGWSGEMAPRKRVYPGFSWAER